MKVKKLNTIITEFETPEILSVNYDLDKLEIEYSVNEKEEFWIRFSNPVAFKCLDERDLMDYWRHKELIDNWILEVFEGGWIETEKSRAFISHEIFELREFLVAGLDQCIFVLCTSEPTFEKKL